jgi:hypothetical protein
MTDVVHGRCEAGFAKVADALGQAVTPVDHNGGAGTSFGSCDSAFFFARLRFA